MLKATTIQESRGDRLFLLGIYMLLTVVLIIVLFPLIFIISSSFSSPQAVVSGKVWLFPVDFTLEGYKAVFRNPQIVSGYSNSLFYAVAGTAVNVALIVMLAYPMEKKKFYGRNFIMVLLVITMMFDGGLIPFYLVVKNLHMLGTRWAMILPGAMAVFQVIVARTFFQTTIPDEIAEAAELDGCSDIRFITSIVIPHLSPYCYSALQTDSGCANADVCCRPLERLFRCLDFSEIAEFIPSANRAAQHFDSEHHRSDHGIQS